MVDLGTTLAGVSLPFPAMNTPGLWGGSRTLRALAASRTGAVVLRTATTHPFVHPQFRSLHNPGFDKLLPLARELAGRPQPVIASVAGSTAEEYQVLVRAFGDAGAALVQVDLAESWVEATLAPFEAPAMLAELAGRIREGAEVPLVVRLPARPALPFRVVGEALASAGVRAVTLENEFLAFEKFLLEVREPFDVVAVGAIRSGYDVARALQKGACAVQVGGDVAGEGPGLFARLEREMRLGRGERPDA